MKRKSSKTDPLTPEQQIAMLQAQLASLARDNETLARDNSMLIAEAARLAAEKAHVVAEKVSVMAEMSAKMEGYETKIESLEARMARLVEMLKLANMRFFGSKSEKVIPDQLSLFNDVEVWADASKEEPELDSTSKTSTKPRKRGGRRRINTANLERVIIEHTIKDPSCSQCGESLSKMKIEVTEVIRLVPAHLVVEEHRRHVYKCSSCCKANAAGDDVSAQIVRAPMPTL
uniref:IS66 family transposase zinc-finger binding domain-containing protein n=1 Tax=Adlercreutzia sp. ZJ141 TaxID=2709406 RepID=UPI00197EF214